MANTAQRQSPRVEATPWLRLLPAATRFNFRGNSAAQATAGAAFGLAFPTLACRAAMQTGRAALWLGPDEQLLLAPAEDGVALRAALTAALGTVPHSLVDISHRQVALELRGPDGAWLLNAGCPLDLDLAAFPVGMCTRTVFMKAEVVLWRPTAETFQLEVWRSFTDYVVGILNEVARELPR
jgi:sarcosine oxidase subunit gamma